MIFVRKAIEQLRWWRCAFMRSGTIPSQSRRKLTLDCLEDRSLPSAGVMEPFATIVPGDTAPFSPQDLRTAYGLSSISNTGANQTIAIVDAYDDPRALSDLQTFDARFGLADPPVFTKVNQSGIAANYPRTDPTGGWELEESLDIEWAHSMAPGANIVLVEANNNLNDNLFAAVKTAENYAGVSVVSMSWGSQGGFSGETSYDNLFSQPGITFVGSTGDKGSPGSYPAESPSVVAVGGSTLTLVNGSQYGSEVAWNQSGGGVSRFEARPTFQDDEVAVVGSHRGTPDVSFDANPRTGVAVYDSFEPIINGGTWVQVGGTSLGSPSWAGLIADADEARADTGLTPLSSAQTLAALYAAPAADFHDITSGTNGGYNAHGGYDLVTGLGTPLANLLVTGASSFGATAGASPPASSDSTNGSIAPSINALHQIQLKAPDAASFSSSIRHGSVDAAINLDDYGQRGSSATSGPQLNSLNFNLPSTNLSKNAVLGDELFSALKYADEWGLPTF